MLDPRVTKLAELLCTHSTSLGPSDSLLIHAFGIPEEAVAELVRVAQSKGAKVAVRLESHRIKRQLMLGMTEPNASMIAEIEKFEMEQMTAYIALRGGANYAELSDVPPATMAMWDRVYGECGTVSTGCRSSMKPALPRPSGVSCVGRPRAWPSRRA